MGLRSALAVIGAVALGAGMVVAGAPARASDLGYAYDDVPAPVVTREVIVERPVVVRPRPVVREVIVERPVVVRPRPVVREVIVEGPVVVRPRRAIREVLVEREGFYGPRPFRPRAVRYSAPIFDPYD